MKHQWYVLSLLALLPVVVTPTSMASGDGAHWAYKGEAGSEHWGDLSPKFIQCKVGVNQSPINIVDSVESDLPPLVLDYQSSTVSLTNNGHTAQMNVEPGNFLRVEGEEFELLQFHIHVPSEHWINGKQHLLEVHYVHKNAEGQLAVIAMLYDEGEDSPSLHQFMSLIPTEAGKTVPFTIALNKLVITHADKSYYRYNGSLTTPPCSEGVRWYVLKTLGAVSLERRDLFNKLIGDDARGPQPINARPVLQ